MLRELERKNAYDDYTRFEFWTYLCGKSDVGGLMTAISSMLTVKFVFSL